MGEVVNRKNEQEEGKEDGVEKDSEGKDGAYVYFIPEGQWKDHFSSLLLSADVAATCMEVFLLGSLQLLSVFCPQLAAVEGSMTAGQVVRGMVGLSFLRRFYNSYLEAVYCSFEQYRTQPAREHKLKSLKDITGREEKELTAIIEHDRLTLVSQFALEMTFYFLIPGFYPAQTATVFPLPQRILTLVLNHYLVSFTMYWMHRSLHVVPWLWRHIHSWHHWAKHPLSRTTYQDHWADNFMNAIVGHGFAQVLIPLDFEFFWISRAFRVCESLEKHSGISCWLNFVHSLQRWFPFAQMPHHHDWHHEGHKACNFTFTSIGGLWDCVFGTRKTGRHPGDAETRRDKRMAGSTEKQSSRTKSLLDHPAICLSPVFAVGALAALKLSGLLSLENLYE